MGEVPRIRVDPRHLDDLRKSSKAITRLFGVRLGFPKPVGCRDGSSGNNDDEDDEHDERPSENRGSSKASDKNACDRASLNEAAAAAAAAPTYVGCGSFRERNENEAIVVELEMLLPGALSGSLVVAGDAVERGEARGDVGERATNVDEGLDLLSTRSLFEIAARVQRYVDRTVLGSDSATADAEDSSYDSDCEADDSTGSASVNQRLNSRISSSTHADVSRTTSDTLAAEFAEYVTLQGPSPIHSPGYTARVEFGLKLGYTERLVQTALEKLGSDPEQNELLAELIKLGASSAKFIDTPDDTDYLFDPDFNNDEISNFHAAPGLRPVVVDGSNVAMSHGNKEIFSCRGIKICVDWFRSRGHKEITVFVPKWRKEASRPDNPIADREILGELERDRVLVFTPSRLVGGKRMVCYDDRYILRLAAELDGIVVSNDNYRDLAQETPEFRRVVEERILMYSFVNDRFMPPDDPLGRSGPTLDNFLRIGPRRTDPAPPCPYAKKCTYGNKCKFRHPERGPHPHKSVTERLVEHAKRHFQARGPSLSLPLPSVTSVASMHPQHQPLCRARSALPGSIVKSSTSVPKSRSVENVTADANRSSAQQMLTTKNSQGYPSPVGWPTPRVNNPDPETANMHRKLQRQLTLNPACDPRLYQLRRYHQQAQQLPQLSSSQHQQQQQQQQVRQQQSLINTPHTNIQQQHRSLTRHASNEAPYSIGIQWERPDHPNHQHVTRIASAPDSYRGWPPRGTIVSGPTRGQRLGTSDPQLNLLPSGTFTSARSGWGAQTQDARRRLHYHLANIFPEEQVQAAMAMNPHVTDPQQICAAILTMFPKP